MRNSLDKNANSSGSPTFRDIVLYNMSAVSLNVYDTILSAWVLFFYVPPQDIGHIQYIPMAAIGVILAGGRILDAVTDPLIGYLSDNTKSRWGRRKPYIFISTPILFLSFIFIWFPPVKGNSLINAVFLVTVLFFYYWAYTGVLIPWFAVLPEMSNKNSDRIKIATVGVVIGVFGALIGGGLSGPLLERVGAFKMAVALGLVAFICGELTLLGVRENYRAEVASPSPGLGGFLNTMKQVFSDRQVLSFSVMIMLVQMTYQLLLMNVPYFTTLILGQKESDASMLMAKIIIIMAISTPLWSWILNKFPKRNVFRVIIASMMAGFGFCFFIGTIPFLSTYTQTLIILGLTIIPYRLGDSMDETGKIMGLSESQ